MERYKITKKLGTGSQATAYLAHAVADPAQRYVLKRIPLDTITSVEMGIMMRIKHENIIRCYEAFSHEDSLYLVLQWADGGDLDEFIQTADRTKAPLPEDTVLRLFAQIITAVQYCHDNRVMHRDIKPANVFLSKDQRTAFLGDFGVAKVMERTVSVSKTLVGSPVCMSPEVVSGTPYTFSSDVWALGCLLYEMVALRSPFPSTNFAHLVAKLCSGTYDPLPPETAPHIVEAVEGMLQVEPEKRWPLSQVASHLAAHLDEDDDLESSPSGLHSPTSESPTNLPPQAPKGSITPRSPTDAPRPSPRGQHVKAGRRVTKAPKSAKAVLEQPAGGGGRADLDQWLKWKFKEIEQLQAKVASCGLRPDGSDDDSPLRPPKPERNSPEPLKANRAKRMLPSPVPDRQPPARPDDSPPPHRAGRPSANPNLAAAAAAAQAQKAERQKQREQQRQALKRQIEEGREQQAEAVRKARERITGMKESDHQPKGRQGSVTPRDAAVRRPSEQRASEPRPPSPQSGKPQGKAGAKERSNIRDMIREQRAKNPQATDGVEIVLPANLQHLR